jgi:hypothetical protein
MNDKSSDTTPSLRSEGRLRYRATLGQRPGLARMGLDLIKTESGLQGARLDGGGGYQEGELQQNLHVSYC